MSPVSLDRRSLLALLVGTSSAFGTGCLLAQNNPRAAQNNPRDDDVSLDVGSFSSNGNVQLQAIGALGVGHIQSTLGLIGVLADSLSKNLYNPKQVDDLMNGTINGLESPKRMLRRLQESNISADDVEFLDRMVSIFNALQREAKALAVYAKSRKPEDAVKFEKARKDALRKLGELTHQEELLEIDATPQSGPNLKTGKPVETGH